MRQRRLRFLVAVGLVALAAFLVRAISLDAQSLWRDEVDALRYATAPGPEMIANFIRPGWNGPLYFLSLRGWITLTGTSEYAMRFFSLFFGVLCVPLIYILGHFLLDRTAGLIAALLMATSPYLTWYSQEVKMYTLISALALLAIYGLRRAIEEGGWLWWGVQIAATTFAFYSHILAALLVLVQVLLYLAWWPRARRRWREGLISLICLTLPYLPLARWQAPMALQTRDTGFHPYSLPQMVEILLSGWGLGITGWGWPWGGVLMGLLAVWGLLSSLLTPSDQGRRRSGTLALLIWLAIPLLVVRLITLWQPLFTDRYLIWSAAAFYLLVASGEEAIWRCADWERWAMVPLVGAVLILDGVNLRQQATTPIKSNFRAVAAYIDEYHAPRQASVDRMLDEREPFRLYLPLILAKHRKSDELIIFQIPRGRYAFDYYFPIEEYPWAEGLYTNHRAPDGAYRMSKREAASRMAEMTRGYDAIWLVASEVHMWDERGLVQKWLDEHVGRVDDAHFAQVDVYRYVRSD